MNLRLPIAAAAALALAVLPASCSSSSPPSPDNTPLQRVVATIPPLYGLIRPLLPDSVQVAMLIGPGQSVHGHRLTPSEVALARTADVIFAVGMGMEEGALEQFQRDRPEHQTIAVFADMIAADTAHTHAHEHEHDHADLHLWLDPVLAAQFVQSAATLLIDRAARSPAGQDLALDIVRRRDDWLTRIRAVDADYRSALSAFDGRTVLTQHPAFGLLLERYGLHEFSLRRTPGQGGPISSELADALRTIRDHKVAAVFLEPQQPSELARRIAEQSGLPIGTLDPLGAGDWEAFMRRNLDSLVTTLTAGTHSP